MEAALLPSHDPYGKYSPTDRKEAFRNPLLASLSPRSITQCRMDQKESRGVHSLVAVPISISLSLFLKLFGRCFSSSLIAVSQALC